MRRYYKLDERADAKSSQTLFLSLMLILLSLFIFLTSFTEKDRKKVETFKKYFKKSLMFTGKGNVGNESINDFGANKDPLNNIILKMRSRNVDVKLMVKYLTLKNIKELSVNRGINGVVLALPEVVRFRNNKPELDFTGREYLSKILFLVKDLPYEVEIRGYTSLGSIKNKKIVTAKEILKSSAERAMLVYRFFIGNGVAPEKLFVSGYGNNAENKNAVKDKVEIFFKDLR